jgi:hypothetical protein
MPIPEQTIVVRASRAEVLDFLRRLPATLHTSGARPVQRFLVRLGLSAQGFLYEGFLAKSEGLADASGLRWKKLAAATIRKKQRTAPANARRILREFDDLKRSLRPGMRPENAGDMPPRIPLQVFRVRPGSVTFGTSRPEADKHHRGTRRLPRRRLWPQPERWPTLWWRRLLGQASQGIVHVIASMLGGRRP